MPSDRHPMIAALSLLAAVADSAGDARFYGRLLQAFGRQLRADLSMVMRYSRRRAPEYVIHTGLEPAHMDLYLRGLYRVDPVYRLCRQRRVQGVKDLAAVSTPADRSGAYFNIFLRLTGMADDLVILLPLDAQTYLGLVYERASVFRAPEIALMRSLYPLIESLHRLHRRLIRPPTPRAAARGTQDDQPGLRPIDHEAALAAFLRDETTPRERDIVHLVLLGYPNIKIAERLKISLNTVKNHKKRLYAKLDITTERELLAPRVIPGQVDMVPVRRSYVLQSRIIERPTLFPKRRDAAIDVDGVPKDDGGRDQIQTARAIPLSLKGAVPDFTEAVDAHRAGQVVTQFALVQDRGHPTPKPRIQQPIEDEHRALDAAEFAQREREAVLPRIAAELT